MVGSQIPSKHSSLTERLLKEVMDLREIRYAGPDMEALEAATAEVVVKQNSTGLRGFDDVGITQISFHHLRRMLRTPPPGDRNWPRCNSQPGCVFEYAIRSQAKDPAITAWAQNIPDLRAQAWLTPNELADYTEHGKQPLDWPTRRCMACLLNWQNQQIAICFGAALDAQGCNFEQRVTMHEDFRSGGLHPSWLLRPSDQPAQRVFGFVAPMPLFMRSGVEPMLIRNNEDGICGIRFDPTTMTMPIEQVVSGAYRLKKAEAQTMPLRVAIWHQLRLMPVVPPLAHAACSLPRTASQLTPFREPSLRHELPSVSKCLQACTTSNAIPPSESLTTVLAWWQRTKEWLSCEPSWPKKGLCQLIHTHQGQLISVFRQLSLRPTTKDTLTSRQLSTLSSSKPSTTSTTSPTAKIHLAHSVDNCFALPLDLCLSEHLPFTIRNLTNKPSTLSPPQRVIQALLAGERTRAKRLLEGSTKLTSAVFLPSPILEAIFDDRIDDELWFRRSLSARINLSVPEQSMDITQRVYLWLFVATFLAQHMLLLEVDRPWKDRLYDFIQAYCHQIYSKAWTHSNDPILSGLPRPVDLKKMRQKMRRPPIDVHQMPDRNRGGISHILKYYREHPNDLAAAYPNPLPVFIPLHPDVLKHHTLAACNNIGRLKPSYHCLTCGNTTQDQSREIDLDQRPKWVLSSVCGDTVLHNCRTCINRRGRGTYVVEANMAGQVMWCGKDAWVLCTTCAQQVSLPNCTFLSDWRIVCFMCVPSED